MAKWISLKRENGNVNRFPIGRPQGRAYIDQTRKFWDNGGEGYVNSAASGLKMVIERDEQDTKNLMSQLQYLHRILRQGINIDTFTDLSLSDSTFEARMLREMMTSDNTPLANLKIFDGSRISGLINVVGNGSQGGNIQQMLENMGSAESLKNGSSNNLTRLQVIPIGDKIYMSLSGKGGFYYREGDILIPFSRLTQHGIVEITKKMIEPENLQKAISKIKKFNGMLSDAEEGVKGPGGVAEGDQGPYAAIYRRNRDEQQGGQGNGKQKVPFSLARFLNGQDQSYGSDVDFNNLYTANGKLHSWGQLQGDRKPNEVYKDLVLFSLINGSNPQGWSSILNTNPDDMDQKAAYWDNQLKNFLQNSPQARGKAENELIRAFVLSNNLENRVPMNKDEFVQAVDEDPAVRQLWSQFVNVNNAGYTSAVVKRFNSDFPEGSGLVGKTGNPGTPATPQKRDYGSVPPVPSGNSAPPPPSGIGSGMSKATRDTMRVAEAADAMRRAKQESRQFQSGNQQTPPPPGSNQDNRGNEVPPPPVSTPSAPEVKSASGNPPVKQTTTRKEGPNSLWSDGAADYAYDFRNTMKSYYNNGSLNKNGEEVYNQVLASSNGNIEQGLKSVSNFIRDETGSNPPVSRVYDYLVDGMAGRWNDPKRFFGLPEDTRIDSADILTAFDKHLQSSQFSQLYNQEYG